MKKIGIYPFNNECMIISQYCDMLNNDYCFTEAASPVSWGFAGKSIRTSVMNNYIVCSSPSEFKEAPDVLLVPEFNVTAKAEKGIVNEILNSISSIKELIFYGILEPENKQNIVDECKKFGCTFIDCRRYENKNEIPLSNASIEYPSVPVIAIAGLWENLDKFSITLSLKKKFDENGYKVVVIGSRGYSNLFDIVPFPSFMFDPSISEYDKPLMLNKFINEMIYNSAPDAIIIGIPGAIQSINPLFTNRFGILHYMSFQAFLVDYLILSVFSDSNDEVFFDNLSDVCKFLLGAEPDVFHLSNMYIDLIDSKENAEVLTNSIERSQIDEMIKNMNNSVSKRVMNLTSGDNIDILFNKIIDKLSGVNSVII